MATLRWQRSVVMSKAHPAIRYGGFMQQWRSVVIDFDIYCDNGVGDRPMRLRWK